MSAALDYSSYYDEEEDATSPPKKKESILKELKKRDLPRYGVLVKESEIAEIMGVDLKRVSDKKWPLLLLQFRGLIQNQGFYCTSRGREGDLYILQAHEMPSFNERKNKNAFAALKTRQRSLHMIDESTLSDEAQKKLEFEILRNASMEITMADQLRKRCR